MINIRQHTETYNLPRSSVLTDRSSQA